jgi:phosphate transport system permease protein
MAEARSISAAGSAGGGQGVSPSHTTTVDAPVPDGGDAGSRSPGGAGRLLGRRRRRREQAIRAIFLLAAMSSIVIMGMIVLFLMMEGINLFLPGEPAGQFGFWQVVQTRDITVFAPTPPVGLFQFLFGVRWEPTHPVAPGYGILPLIFGSLAVTFLSSVMAVPLGVLTALYLAVVAGPRLREWVKPGVELLASLPSVILGFLGMMVLAPELANFVDRLIDWGILSPSTEVVGRNVLNASIMLALMAIPTICSISEDALHNVPGDLLEASYALGATKWETTTRVWVPGALSGLGTAVILGMSRAMGETMVVLMAAGGAARIPLSIFDPVRPMPAIIAAEMGETPVGTHHYYALFAIGIVLFLFTLLFNLVADHIAHRYQQRGTATL